jgi:hypothetical protein
MNLFPLMEFTPITPEEFYQIYKWNNKSEGDSPLRKALRELEVGTGFSTPCTWEHNGKTRSCAGVASTHRIIRNVHTGGRVRTRCKDGTLHILRIEDKEENHDN